MQPRPAEPDPVDTGGGSGRTQPVRKNWLARPPAFRAWRDTMADIPARTEMRVTTGPIRGSRQIHVGDRKVAMREILLEGGDTPVRVYDTSGPYSDPEVHIAIIAGLPQLPRVWIMTRGDVAEPDATAVKPKTN